MAEKREWVVIKIHKDSLTYKEIVRNSHQAAWITLEKIVENQLWSEEDKASYIFEKFLIDINDLYPGSKNKLEQLRPLIFEKILISGNNEL